MLDLSLRPWCSPKVVEANYGLEHGCESYLAHSIAKADVWALAKMDVGIQASVQFNFFRVSELGFIVGCSNLEIISQYLPQT